MTDQTNAPEIEETETPGVLTGELLPPEEEEARTDLIVPLKQSTVVTAFATDDGIEALVVKIETEVRKLAKEADAATPEGRKTLISLAAKTARSKTFIEGRGKTITDELRAKLKPMDARRNKSKDRLDALKEEVRGPVTKWEEAEAKRKDDIQQKIAALLASDITEASTVEAIGYAAEKLKGAEITEAAFEEFVAAAELAVEAEIERLHTCHVIASSRERAEKLEKEAQERERAAAEERRKLEEERRAWEAEQAEAKRKADAEAEARRKADEDRRREEEAKRERAEIEAREKEEARQREVEEARRAAEAAEARAKAAEEAAERRIAEAAEKAEEAAAAARAEVEEEARREAEEAAGVEGTPVFLSARGEAPDVELPEASVHTVGDTDDDVFVPATGPFVPLADKIGVLHKLILDYDCSIEEGLVWRAILDDYAADGEGAEILAQLRAE